MNIEELHLYCSLKQGTTESFPFDHKTLVFKVYGKIFALADIDDFCSINLKCDPQYAQELREHYTAIEPGFHMNHKHWNTIRLNLDVDDLLLKKLIDHSYQLVYLGLPKKIRDENPLR
jgi:predicted DNA-binding protein (MmcQ/YjbR family)